MTLTEFLAQNTWALAAAGLMFGLMVGSFLNVVIYRLPVMMEREWTQQCRELLHPEQQDNTQPERFNLAFPGSHCPKCKHAISALENLPVLSWLLQKGRCRHCQAAISVRYPVIEAVTALLSAVVVVRFGVDWFSLAALVLTWTLIALTMIDVDHQLLPDDLTLPLLWLGLALAASGFGRVSLEDSVWGAIAGYGVLWTVYQAFKLLTGKEGMGYGDFKLLGALGAWLGWAMLPQVILLSAFVGAVVGITLMVVKGRDKNIPIPFGPYLAAAGFIALIWGDSINRMYLGTLQV